MSQLFPVMVGVELSDGVVYINPATVSSVLHKPENASLVRPETVLIRTLDGKVHSFEGADYDVPRKLDSKIA